MKRFYTFAALLALALLFTAAPAPTGAAGDKKAAPISLGSVVADFAPPDADGKEHTLASLKGKGGTVIIFVATQCPISNAYNERMEKLAQEYRAKGVNVIGINSNSTEPASEVKRHAAERGLTFAILKDAGNVIADRFDAKVTPEAFLLDASGKLVYKGRIDNSRNGDSITASDLRDAIDAVLAGKPVEKPEVKAFGCSIKRG